jgi:hypothetical protein
MLPAFALALLAAVQDPAPAPAPAPTPTEAPAPKPEAPVASAEERTAAVEATTRALAKLAPRRAELAEGEWSAAEERMGAAVTAFTAASDGLEWEHYARCIQATWRTRCLGACALLCEFALRNVEPTAGLQCQLGMAKFALAQEHPVPFRQRGWAREAAAAFAAARALEGGDELEPAFLFRGQALFIALDYAAAIAELESLLAHPRFGGEVQRPHTQRARALLCGDRAADAVAALDAASKAGEESEGAFLRALALALAGRRDEAVATARASWREQATAEHLTLLVDVLAWAGEHDEAIALLAEHPVERGRKESDADLTERRRARAALAYVVGLRGKRPDDFVPRLVAVLEHEVKIGKLDGFIVHDPSKKEDEQVSLNDSPPAIASWMLQQESSEFGWANDALYVACIDALPKWRTDALSRAMLEHMMPEGHWQELGRPDVAAVARAMLAGHRMLPASDGVLTATKLLAP